MRSKNKGDVYRWLIKVITSCNNIKQLRGCRKLMLRFEKIYKDYIMNYDLDWYYDNKTEEIILREKDIENFNIEQKAKGYQPMNFDL